MSKHTSNESYQSIREEHEQLRELLGQIQQALVSRSESPESVRSLLLGLQQHLRTHFDEEESSGGFFDTVIAEAPRLSDQAEEIKSEHGQLTELLNALLQVASGSESEDWWEQLTNRSRPGMSWV